MKKCPFCHANIEDNARFCVFCMSSLQEKEKIENQPKNNKRWPYILAAFLLLALILVITILALGKNEANNSSEPTMSSDASSTQAFSNVSDILSSENTNENSTPDNSSQDNSSNTTANDSQSNTNSASPNNTTVSTITPSQPEQSDDTNTDNSENENINEDLTQNEVTYTYREATAEDCYPTGYTPIYTPENVIVITGVESVATNGIYVIPEKIDGKKVAAIMPSAFCNNNISPTVKKVVIPSTVRTIWQDAFSKCYNLTDIYIHSKNISIYEPAFPSVSKRTATLTIHCARDCMNCDFYYYRNIAGDYGAVYQEWNGGEIE